MDKVFNRFKKNDLLGEMLLASLLGANIFAAMSVVFAGGDNFKAQPDIINRNFLDHGMLHRKVRRRDCIQLFLILYNFTRYANEYGNMLEINS